MQSLFDRCRESAMWQAIIVVALVCAVQLPLIGSAGFSATEGHRVIPGWEMLDQGDYLVPHMFGRVYLRKPPGMAWAVAASAAVLGESEISARLVSVGASLAMALVAFGFATRWFGKPWGFFAGSAQALFPMFWTPGRSAEIESLHNLATMVAVMAALHLAVARPARRAWPALLLGAGVVIMAAMKGPAGAPALGGALLAAIVATRSIKAVFKPPILVALGLSLAIVTALGYAIAQATPVGEDQPVAQGIGEFIWGGELLPRLGGVALLLPVSFLVGLPLTFTVMMPWLIGDKFRACLNDEQFEMARALSLSWVFSMVILVALGVENHRYAMPSMVMLAPLACATVRVAMWAVKQERPPGLERALFMHAPGVWIVILLICAAVSVPVVEAGRARRSGKEAGETLAVHLEDGARLLADHMIEARPEVLLYARRAAAAEGRDVECRWVDHRRMAEAVRPGDYVLMRTDDLSNEHKVYAKINLVPVAEGSVHQYTFELGRAP